jgi:hypothetical protein
MCSTSGQWYDVVHLIRRLDNASLAALTTQRFISQYHLADLSPANIIEVSCLNVTLAVVLFRLLLSSVLMILASARFNECAASWI